jgi:hypothetical protein
MVKIIPMYGLMSDACNNVLELCIYLIYITVVIICLYVDQQNRKLHFYGFYIFVVGVVLLLKWNM